MTGALDELKQYRQWVAWRYLKRAGAKKPTKVPVDPHTGRNAASNDPATWGTYAGAEMRARQDALPGVGFVLSGDDNITGFDLDNVRNPNTGKIKPWARELLNRAESYAEISPSGTGIRIFAHGKISQAIPSSLSSVEVYSFGRYLTVTGQHLHGTPTTINPAPQTLATCRERHKLHSETWAKLKKVGPRITAGVLRGIETVRKGEEPRQQTIGSEYFKNVNSAALQSLDAWVPDLFGGAAEVRNGPIGGYRISSEALGRPLEEELSITSRGIKDFGVHDLGDANGGKRTPIDLVIEYGAASDPVTAARSLCERMGVKPESLGWALRTEHRSLKQELLESVAPNALKITSAADLEMCGVSWFWPGRFALGKIGLIAGLPDYGKGQIAAFLTAAATADVELPCNEGHAPQGNVIWFNAEDDARDTILPRLVAAGADLSRVRFINGTQVDGKDRSFSLVTDLPLLRKAIEEIGNVVLVILDPISAYLGVGKVDGKSQTDVRGVVTPLKEMAEELNVSVIGITHFNKKDDVKSALLRVSDTIAWTAAPRHVYAVLDDPEDRNSKLFIKVKNNLAADKKALRYGIGVKKVGHDLALDKDIEAPFIVWHQQHVEVTANEAMQAAAGQSGYAKREAREFLLERLEAGPAKSKDVIEEAAQNGIAERTLHRAKKDMQVKSRKAKDRFDGEWTWELPPRGKIATKTPQ